METSHRKKIKWKKTNNENASFLNCTKMQNGQPISSLLIKIPSLGFT